MATVQTSKIVTPERLTTELRRRSSLLRGKFSNSSSNKSADLLEQAANEIEHLREEVERVRAGAEPGVHMIGLSAEEAAIERLLENAGIPVIAEIHPRPDPELGHVFDWPKQEIEQLFNAQSR